MWPFKKTPVKKTPAEEAAVKIVKLLRDVRGRELSDAFNKVREHRRGHPPGASGAELVIVVGFDRMPEASDVSALLSSDKDLRNVRVFTLKLSGEIPSNTDETRAIVLRVAEEDGSPRIAHAIDWGKVTYEVLHNFLIVHFWR
jgi:hypothetical protein